MENNEFDFDSFMKSLENMKNRLSKNISHQLGILEDFGQDGKKVNFAGIEAILGKLDDFVINNPVIKDALKENGEYGKDADKKNLRAIVQEVIDSMQSELDSFRQRLEEDKEYGNEALENVDISKVDSKLKQSNTVKTFEKLEELKKDKTLYGQEEELKSSLKDQLGKSEEEIKKIPLKQEFDKIEKETGRKPKDELNYEITVEVDIHKEEIEKIEKIQSNTFGAIQTLRKLSKTSGIDKTMPTSLRDNILLPISQLAGSDIANENVEIQKDGKIVTVKLSELYNIKDCLTSDDNFKAIIEKLYQLDKEKKFKPDLLSEHKKQAKEFKRKKLSEKLNGIKSMKLISKDIRERLDKIIELEEWDKLDEVVNAGIDELNEIEGFNITSTLEEAKKRRDELKKQYDIEDKREKLGDAPKKLSNTVDLEMIGKKEEKLSAEEMSNVGGGLNAAHRLIKESKERGDFEARKQKFVDEFNKGKEEENKLIPYQEPNIFKRIGKFIMTKIFRQKDYRLQGEIEYDVEVESKMVAAIAQRIGDRQKQIEERNREISTHESEQNRLNKEHENNLSFNDRIRVNVEKLVFDDPNKSAEQLRRDAEENARKDLENEEKNDGDERD